MNFNIFFPDRRSLSASIAFSLFISFFVVAPAHSADPTNRFWDPGTPITGGQITAPANNLQVAPGALVNCVVATAADIDHWRTQWSPNEYEADQVFYSWTSPDGSFSTPDSSNTTWTAPLAAGNYTLIFPQLCGDVN